jgi:hypothetical protein
MPQDTIIILHGDPATHQLELSDHGYSTVDLYDRIHWIIEPSSNVASIERIHKKHGKQIFILGPTTEASGWTGKAMFSTGLQDVYEYEMTWIEKTTGKRYTTDPKIAVNPGFNFWLLILIAVIVLLLGGIGVKRLFFTKK